MSRLSVCTELALDALFCASCILLPLSADGQDSTPPPASAARSHDQAPVARAARREGPVRIDGRLDEAAWQAAPVISGFRQFDPDEGQPVSERTEARILVDDEAIYIGMRLFDREPGKIQAQLARRDDPLEGDLVEVTFDSYHDHLSAFIFRLSPLGARRDAVVSSTGNQDNSWDAVWEGSGTLDAEGWSAEFRIPLSQLRYDPNAPDHTWGLQLSRKISRRAELAYFAFTPKAEQQGINRYGHLAGLGRLPSPRRIELVPYALARNENPVVRPGDPFRGKNDIVMGAGLDAKYAITSNLTLDATINPDFGQVEVDPAVVNLSAFETFFPERRPFFIEGANIFRFGSMRSQNTSGGYTFLHSRRIGRTPQRFLGGPGYDFVDAPHETTIAGAAKLTGRSPGGWSIGLLDAVTMEEEARFRNAAGDDDVAIIEPRSNYFIGRLKRDLRAGNSTVGVGLTAVHRDLAEPELKPLFRRAAYVGGVDWNHAWSNQRFAFDGAIVGSHNVGSAQAIDALQLSSARYYQRPDKERFRRDSTRESLTGYVAEATFAKLSGNWKGSVSYQEYNPGFEVNEAGFLGSTDMRSVTPLIYYDQNKPGKYVRGWEQYLFWNPSWNFDGDMTFNGVGAITFAEMPNFWGYFLRFDWRPPVFDDGLTRGGPVARVVSGGGVQLEINSDRRKRYTGGLFTSYSYNTAGGRGYTVGPRAVMRPTTAMRITLQPTYTFTHAMAQYVTRVSDALAADTYGARYVFATLDQRQLAMVTRLDWTYTPRLSLQLFAQPLLAAADFHDYKEFARPREFEFEIYGQDRGTISRSATGVYTVDPDGALGTAPSFTFGDRDFNRRSLRGNAVVRWEYRPGSALFFVWQQSRFASVFSGEFDLANDFTELWSVQPENVFVVKGTWWVGR